MVVFTCGHCGESVQKPKVEKHYLTKCRNRNQNLSCMDCFKDFLGNDYEAHTKCITEEERYSGKGFIVKEKKGEKKQNAWVEMLQSVLEEQKSASGNVLRIIESISKHNNTPRKKPKFVNFVKNVCGHKTNASDIDQAWALISVKLSELSSANAANKNQNLKNGNVQKDEISNGDVNEKELKSLIENPEENHENVDENIEIKPKVENGVTEDKKLSKKQKKQEKKRQKYEAELQSAVAPPVEEAEKEEDTQSKKGKKKKNKSESSNNGTEDSQGSTKGKNQKRKRQDTTNSVQNEVPEIDTENIENVPVNKPKAQKKKVKLGEEEEADESVCLHDQNVAKSEEASEVQNSEKFNWHAIIMSVLQKKGNELPFKRLQKKVLSEYAEITGSEIDDRIADKFIKKLKSAPNVRVDKNRVLLLE